MSGETVEPESFAVWVENGRDRWLRGAYLLTGDLARAEDLVQDGLVAVARRWKRLADGHPEAYLRRCIYHAHVSWWRRRRETPVAEVVGVGFETASASEDRIVLFEALSRLTPKQRAVLVLRYFEDLSEKDAADVLGVTVGTVKSQTAASLRRLRVQSPGLADLRGPEGGIR